MENNNSFKKKIAVALAGATIKAEQINQAVFNYCVDAGFITSEDQMLNSKRYKWLLEVVNRNILSLSLLEQIILDVSEPSIPSEVQTEVDAKAALIIKDIAKRIMDSAPECPSISKDWNSVRKRKVDMK